MKTPAQPARRLSLATIFSFSASLLPISALATAMQIYIQPYMARNLGLQLVTIGAAFFIVRMIDTSVDPLLAVIMDRTRTPIGRYRPWMFAGLPVLGLAVYELFFAKPGVGESFLIVWLLVYALGASLITLARNAWSANLVTRYDQRSRFYGYMAALGAVGVFIVLFIPVLAPPIAAALHVRAPNNVHLMGWTILALIPLGGLMTGLLVPERVNIDAPARRFGFRDYWELATMPEVLRLSISAFALALGPFWMSNLYIFFFTDARGFTEQSASGLLLAYFAAGVLAAPFVGLIGSRFTKHRTMIAVTILYSLGLCTVMLLPKGNFWATVPVLMWCGANAIGFDLMTSAMMADVGDEVRLKQGKERMALLFALTGLAAKLASAGAVIISYPLLQWAGYQPKAGAHNTPAAISHLEAIFILGPIFWVTLGGLCFVGWRLDARKHADIRLALEARDALLSQGIGDGIRCRVAAAVDLRLDACPCCEAETSVGSAGMRVVARGLALVAICLTLSGCLTFGSIGDRGMALNEGIGGWQNRGILLNLVRASRGEPLYFLSLNNATGSASTDLKFGYPLFTLGPHLTLPQKQYSFGGGGTNVFDNTTMTQFQVNVYSNQAFYQGIMQPVTLDEVNLLLNQGFPRELIFLLVIDKAKLTDKNGNAFFVYNDPTSPQYGLFVQAIKAAMVHGLTTEVPNPDLMAAEPSATSAAPAPAAASEGGGATPPNAAAPGLTVQRQPPPGPQLCFEQALATDDAKKEFAELTAEGKPPNFCGHTRAQRQLSVRLLGQDYEVEVFTRSVSSIFRYLGAALAHPEKMPVLVDYGVPSEVTPEGPILNVQSQGGISGLGCFAHVYYADQAWCVPEHGPQITRDVFNVLTMLVALKQQPGDLPASSTVLIGG